jgi:hypothetical protein
VPASSINGVDDFGIVGWIARKDDDGVVLGEFAGY